jgi:carbon monoxide dehydrogenase subunit G
MDELKLHETAQLVEGVADDGTVLLHLIRPCIGRGRGRHLYEADMLERNAGNFAGWKMYVDHQSPEARKAAGGLPRSIRDLGGRILESWWDPNVPAEGRFGQGAVVGRAKPTPFVASLIEHDPGLVESSINSNATGVKPIMRDGVRVMLVEGIQKKGTVDWVTEAGAGGKVVELMEAAAADADETFLESLEDDEFAAYLENARPGLLDALAEAKGKKGDGDAEDKADGGADEDAELQAKCKAYEKKGLPHGMAMKAAKRAMASAVKEAAGKDEDMDVTPEALAEALSDPQVAAAFLPLIEAAVEERVAGMVEAAIAEERDMIRAEARADADRQIELRDLRDQAHDLIAEAKLPEALAESMRAEFALVEGIPTIALDVVDDYDADGNRTKTASEVLAEAVTESVTRGRDLVAQLNPTRVRAVPGTTKPDGETPTGDQKPDRLGDRTRALLESAGVPSPDDVYQPVGD